MSPSNSLVTIVCNAEAIKLLSPFKLGNNEGKKGNKEHEIDIPNVNPHRHIIKIGGLDGPIF